jgi:hypothetical protein
MYRKSWPEQHPVLTGVGILLGACFVASLWWLFLTLGVLAGIGYGAYKLAMGWDKRRIEGQQRRQALLAHADYEHWLWMSGDSRGFYGQYPPAL